MIREAHLKELRVREGAAQPAKSYGGQEQGHWRVGWGRELLGESKELFQQTELHIVEVRKTKECSRSYNTIGQSV